MTDALNFEPTQISNKSFHLTHTCDFKDALYNATTKSYILKDQKPFVSQDDDIWIQVGNTFGVLFYRIAHPNGNVYYSDFFFTLSEYDRIFSKCMRPSLSCKDAQEVLHVNMPHGVIGSFQKTCSSQVFSNEYILDIVTHVNDSFDNVQDLDSTCYCNKSLNFFFVSLQRKILTQRAFQKLYFRCFRKSFAPTESGFQREVKSYSKEFL